MAENEEKLKRLKAIRSGNRGVVTKYTKEAIELLNGEDKSTTVSERLNTIGSLLNEKIERLKELDCQILDLCDVADIVKDIDETEEVYSRVCDVQVKITKFTSESIDKTSKSTEQTAETSDITEQNVESLETQVSEANFIPSSPQSTNTNTTLNTNTQIPNTNSTASTNMPNSVRSKLPKLTLPKFKGQVTKWGSFWDSYSSAIHDNSEISKIDKFNYLNSLLEGAALRAIQGLTLTGANYDSAIEILKDRFGRPQQIITAHMDEILKIPACTGDRLSSLRFVYDSLSVHVRGLQSLGISPDQYGSLLIPIIMAKLPNDIRLEVARKSANGVWKIDELLNTIKFEVEAREASETAKTSTNTPYGQRSEQGIRNRPPKDPLTAAALLAAQNDTKGNFKIQCVYCGEYHYSASCTKVQNLDQRKGILRRDRRCFVCLQRGHRAKECNKPNNCRKCRGSHHQSICAVDQSKDDNKEKSADRNVEGTTAKPAKVQNEASLPKPEQVINTTANTGLKPRGVTQVLLQTATVLAFNPESSRKEKVRVLFDSGSQRSYVTSSLKSKLRLSTSRKETLHLNTFGDEQFRKQSCEEVKLGIQGMDGEFTIEVKALAFPVICSPVATRVNLAEFTHLDGLEFADDTNGTNGTIDILIGADYYYEVVTGEIIKGDDGPTAVASKFGWLLTGPVKLSGAVPAHAVTNLVIDGNGTTRPPLNDNYVLNESLKRFWDLESLGITEPKERNEHEFLEDIKFVGPRYEVGLPWKEGQRHLVNRDLELCTGRLKSLVNRLEKDPELLSEYNNIIEYQLRKGIVEKVPVNELDTNEAHYLPHHGVVRSGSETTKLRVVFDGSAKENESEQSINDHLETGPNFIPPLFDTLIKFRSYPIALTADIEKAFLQIEIKQEDRNKLRFLWMDDLSSGKPQLLHLRFCRLVFGLKPSPAILGATVNHHLEKHKESDPEAVHALQDLYVDDLPTGASDDEEAFKIYESTKRVMKCGGFNLRKWKSNSKALSDRIAKCEATDTSTREHSTEVTGIVEDDRTYVETVVGPQAVDESKTKILGVSWDTKEDELFFEFSEITSYAMQLPRTKRSVLKTAAKFFDPIGFLSPVTVRLKMLFQTLCKEQSKWDDELQGEALKLYNKLLLEMEKLSGITVPRCYFIPTTKVMDIQLHGFCDASQRAFAGVVYVRTVYENGIIIVRLAAAKSKVSPMKQQTIPRLELLGANILARLTSSVSNALADRLGQLRTFHWTDSSAVLCWIRNEKPWKQYVSQRVKEIRNLTDRESWNHCPGAMNPADLPSRGIQVDEIVSNSLWWNGPSFLQRPEEEWPKLTSQEEIDPTAEAEIVKQPKLVTRALVGTISPQLSNVAAVIDCKRYSSKLKLLRVTGYVFRFIYKLKRRVKHTNEQTSNNDSEHLELSAFELINAEKTWIQAVQESSFAQELKYLRNQPKTSPPANVRNLGLYIDADGLLKSKGRLNNAPILPSEKRPILLPSKHYFTNLVIRQVHQEVMHSGITHTLSMLRERFWILRGRETVKRILKECVVCRRHQARTCSPQPTPDLPRIRVDDAPPFANTGLDFLGPLYITEGKHSDKNTSSKVYVCLYTCASTRAIHLELTRALSNKAFLLSFRRFASRRGLPSHLISDNATTFKSASKEIERICRSKEVQSFLASRGITWQFIVERAPWWGGFWERLVRSVKIVLKKIIGRSTLDYDELSTVLIEIGVINTRPITYVYDDEESVSYALSPSQLIYGRRLGSSPNSQHYEIVSTNASLTKRAKRHKHILRQFTIRWRKEYLLNLRKNSRVNSKRQKTEELSVRDVVIIKNDKTNRNFWRLGKVEELISGDDGVVRAAKVRVGNENGRSDVLRRTIQHLVPLEVNRNSNLEEVKSREIENSTAPAKSSERNKRPRRAAAIASELLREELLNDKLL